MIDVIQTVERWNEEAQQWKFVEQDPEMLIFQTFDWCKAAWECVLSKSDANKLWVLKWTQDGRDDVVYFPFYIDGRGTLRIMLDSDTDACNAVYKSIGVNRYWCYREVADAIKAEPRIKRVWIQKMRCDSEMLDYLGVFLSGALVYKDNAYARMSLKEGGDITCSQAHMRSSDRKHWRQLLRKSERFGFAVLSKSNGDAFPEADIRQVAKEMSDAGLRKVGFLSDELIAFAGRLYNNGLCEIPVLKEDGKIVTIEFRLLKGEYTLDWIFLSKNPSTGTEINVKYCTERAKTHSGVLDFGVGAYEYKILTTRPEVGVTFSLRYSKGFVAGLRDLVSLGVRLGKDMVKVALANRKEH